MAIPNQGFQEKQQAEQPAPKSALPRTGQPVRGKRAGTRQSIPADAVQAALADGQRISHLLHRYHRWIWVRSAETEDFQAVSDVLNRVSRGREPFLPIAGGILVRVDLRSLADNERDVEELIQIWENFAFDGFFSFLITGDTVRLLSEIQKQSIFVTRRRRVWPVLPDGSYGDPQVVLRTVAVADIKDLVVERANPEHLAHSGIEMLQAATGSLAPVVSDTHFVGLAMSTIKDRDKVDGKEKESLFNVLYGGLYNDFNKIRKSVKKGRTDLDQFLIDIGANAGDLPFQKLFDQLPSSQRAAMFASNVTAKPRRIIWLPTQSTRATESESLVMITVDVENKDVDSSGHAILNLEDGLIAKAFEVIAIKPNGHQLTAVFNGQGVLLEQADSSSVVSDRTVPAPHTTSLEAIGCCRCHGQNGGWMPFKNDVQTLAKEIDVFGAYGEVQNFDRIRKLQSQYRGDSAGVLARLRRFHARAVLLSTGPWVKSKDQTDVVELSSARISALFAKHRYRRVGPAVALQELGEPPVAAGKETATIKLLLAAPKPQPGEFVFDDPRLAFLRAGGEILWNDWNLVYSFAMQQAARNRKKAG
jgi:hypothetical protein